MGKAYIGTNGSDALTIPYSPFDVSGTYAAGLAGDDRLVAGNQYNVENFVSLYGGSGNDTYVLDRNSCAIIADTSGNDTVSLPFTVSEFIRYNPNGYSSIIDGAHYYLELFGMKLLVANFAGEGKTEMITFKDGAFSFDEMWSMYGDVAQTGTSNDLGPMMKLLFDQSMNQKWVMAAQENTTHFGAGDPALAIAAYFDEDTYLQNKANALNATNFDVTQYWTSYSTKTAIENAGMTPLQHFMTYGAFEKNAQGEVGIDPSAKFDASAYYASKVAQCAANGENYSLETLVQIFQNAGLDPVTHFAVYGFAEGLGPQPVAPIGVQAMNVATVDVA